MGTIQYIHKLFKGLKIIRISWKILQEGQETFQGCLSESISFHQ